MQYCYILYLIFLIFLYQQEKCKKTMKISNSIDCTQPKDLTAAQVALFCLNGSQKNILSISLLQMVIRNFFKLTVKIDKDFIFKKRIYFFERTENPASNIEEEVFDQKTFILNETASEDAQIMLKKLEKIIEKEGKSYCIENKRKIFFATYLVLLFSFNFSIFLTTMLYSYLSSIVYHKRSFLLHVFRYIFIIPVMFHFLISEQSDKHLIGLGEMLMFCLIGLTSITFAFLLKRPTEKSIYAQEYIKSLQQFFISKATSIGENKTEKSFTKKQMEELLPYAIALKLEREWQLKFKELFGEKEYNSIEETYSYVLPNNFQLFSWHVFCERIRYNSRIDGSFLMLKRYFGIVAIAFSLVLGCFILIKCFL